MAEESSGERTEEPTYRKRERMREEGRVAHSRELAAAAVLLGGMILLRWGGGTLGDRLSLLFVRLLGTDLGELAVPQGVEIVPYVHLWLVRMIEILGPFLLGVFLIALLINLAQVGFLFAPVRIAPNWENIHPVRGLMRIFSLRTAIMMVMHLLKLAAILVVVYVDFAVELPRAIGLAELLPAAQLHYGALSVVNLGLHIAIVLFLLAVLDALYQNYQHLVENRMTKQEVKEELKEMEGDPQIRQRRRAIQRQLAMQRMMQEIPKAEVVVRNPTHYAVAVRYKPEDTAPIVVAKGMDLLALRMIEIAIRHGVPTWQDPPLARQLFKVEVGSTIPPALFQALAQVLAHVLKGEKLAAYQRRMSGSA